MFDDLYTSLAVQRLGLRFEFIGMKFFNHFFGIRLLGGSDIGHQRTLNA
jgi:hypothetical protein